MGGNIKIDIELPDETFSVFIPIELFKSLREEWEAAQAFGNYDDFKKQFDIYRVDDDFQDWLKNVKGSN